MLARISPLLHGAFVRGVAAPVEKEKARDFTNQIKIGARAFPIRTIKGGRKLVTMEWDALRPVLQEISPANLPTFRNLRGTIVWSGREIFAGMKLGTVLSLAPFLHTDEGV
jgi:hypothetical protein